MHLWAAAGFVRLCDTPSKRPAPDRWPPPVAVVAPALCWVLDANQAAWLNGWQVGVELLVLNGALTFGGLWGLAIIAARRLGAATLR